MKKIITLLAASFAVLSLASCNNNKGDGGDNKIKNVSGGTAEEQQAVQDAVTKRSVVLKNGKDGLIPEQVHELAEDDGTFIQFTTSQKVKVSGKNYTVNLEWEAEENAYCSGLIERDGYVQYDPVYPGYKGTEGNVEINLKKISCGGASSTEPEYKFTFKIKGQKFYHKDLKIKDVNKLVSLGDGKYGYDIVDYTKDSPYFKSHEENKDAGDKSGYYYVNVVGKVIYLAPDGNWGLIADGDQILEIYQGAGIGLTPENWANLDVGKYVKVVGNMGHYYGNIQLGFITQIKEASASDLDNEPTMNFQNFDATSVQYIKNEFGGHKQCVYGANLSNALAQFTGTIDVSSLRDRDGNEVTVANLENNRFTFQIDIGSGEKVRLAYDYHMDSDGTKGIFNALKTALGNPSATHTFKGTLRYCGDDNNGFVQSSTIPGEWQICPFDASHIA